MTPFVPLGPIYYNFNLLISAQYSPDKKEIFIEGKGIDAGVTTSTGQFESTSTLKLIFVGMDHPITRDGAIADEIWNNIKHRIEG